MHHKKLVHRDLHGGNVLLNMSSDACHAVLIDFGKTLRIDKAKNVIPHAARLKNPPEVLNVNWSKLDRYKVDIYALGCLFFQILWGKNVPWANLYNVYSINAYGSSQKRWMYGKSVYHYNTSLKHKLGQILRKKKEKIPLTHFEKFKLLIFEMIHFNPKHRPLARKVVFVLNSLQ